jgi:hypothetical protein
MHMFSIIWGTIGLSWLCSSEVQIGSDRWMGASLHHLVSLRALECTRPTFWTKVYLAGDAIPVRMIRQEIPKKSAALQLVKPTTVT